MREPAASVPDQTELGVGPADSDVTWSESWRRLWAPSDLDLVDEGFRGEWLVAGIRVLIVFLLLYFPLDQFLQSPMERGRQIVMWVAVAALAQALVFYSAVRRSWGRRWIGFVSGSSTSRWSPSACGCSCASTGPSRRPTTW